MIIKHTLNDLNYFKFIEIVLWVSIKIILVTYYGHFKRMFVFQLLGVVICTYKSGYVG